MRERRFTCPQRLAACGSWWFHSLSLGAVRAARWFAPRHACPGTGMTPPAMMYIPGGPDGPSSKGSSVKRRILPASSTHAVKASGAIASRIPVGFTVARFFASWNGPSCVPDQEMTTRQPPSAPCWNTLAAAPEQHGSPAALAASEAGSVVGQMHKSEKPAKQNFSCPAITAGVVTMLLPSGFFGANGPTNSIPASGVKVSAIHPENNPSSPGLSQLFSGRPKLRRGRAGRRGGRHVSPAEEEEEEELQQQEVRGRVPGPVPAAPPNRARASPPAGPPARCRRTAGWWRGGLASEG